MPDPNQQVQTPPAQAAPTAAPETITFDTPVATPQPQPETISFDAPAVPASAANASQNAPAGTGGALDVLKKLFTGSGTAAGTPAPVEQQKEVSGLSDIVHGDVSKGLGEVWDSERPHVIPGSPLEKAIQIVQPSFKGAGTPAPATATSKPLVDAAQFIDKAKHPMAKAITEAAQGFTSPDNVAIMAGTGGLGLVDSPLALAKANRLISAGFSAQAISSAYKNLKGFKEAYDKGDIDDAEYQLTHAVLGGTISALAATHAATGEQLPVASDLDKKVAGAAGNAASAVGGKIADTGQALVNVAKDTLSNTKKAVGVGDSFKELVRRTSKPSKGAAAEYDKTLDAAIPQLTEIAKANPNVSTPQEYVEAIQQHIDTKENDLRDQARKLQGATGEPEDKAILTDADKQVSDALDDYFKEHTGAYKPEQIQAAKNEVLDRVRQGAGEEPRNPSLFEAENLRRQLSKETAPMFGSDTSVPNAVRDGKMVANAVLRNLIDGKFDDLGVKDVQEWRKQEAALIDVKDQLSKAFQKANDMGQFNIVQAAIKKSGWALVGSFLGHAPGALGGEALGVAQEYINDRLTNPNRLIERAVKTAGESKAPTGAINPSKAPTAPGSMQVKLPVEVEENPNIPGQASEPGSIKSIVENAGGVFKGNKEGLVEITLPESMTSKLNISEPLKKFVSVTIPEEKVTPEFVKRAINNKLKEFGGTPEPTTELVHKTGDVNQVTARNEDGRNMGTVKYVLSPDKSTASITAAYLDPLFRNQGAGQKMYLRAITEAKNAGAKEITSDLQGSTNLDASRVWEALKKKGYDVESTPTKAGSQGYRLDLASVDDAGNPKVKAENPAVKTNKETIPPDAIGVHPDDLPRRSKVPHVVWDGRDLQDTEKKVTPETIRKDYASGDKKVSIYKSYIPMEDLPTGSVDEDFDREDYLRPHNPVPIKVQVNPDGSTEILDGNHRAIMWSEQDIQYAPAWIVDYRHSDIESLSEDEKAEREENEESDKVKAENPVVAKEITPLELKKVVGSEPSEEGYVYHATSEERAHDIAEEGLHKHGPSEYTDQDAWPDGKVEKRNYFTNTAEHTWQFAPEEGKPVLLRTKPDADFKTESTGDIYTKKVISPDNLEILGKDDQWHPISDLKSEKVKAENPAVNPASEKIEEKEPVDEYHPDLQKVADKYGVSTDASKVENGASFIAPDGKFIHLPNTHDAALASTIGDNDRASFIQDTGAVRTRFSKDRAGRTLHVSVPADGITPDQIDSLKSAVKDAVGRNGNIVMEVAEANGKSAEKQFASANDIEPMLKEIGAHPDSDKIKPKLQVAVKTKEAPELKEARGIYPKVDANQQDGFPERSYIAPNGDNLDAGNSDHFGVREIPQYKKLELDDEGVINKFMNDTGAIRNGWYDGSYLVHTGEIRPTDEQLASLAGSLKYWEPSIDSKVMIETPYGSKEIEESAMTPGRVRRAIEDLYDNKPKDWSGTAGESAAKQDAGGIDPKTGQSDTKGIGTEIMPELRQALDHAPTAEDFKNFYEENKGLFHVYPELRVGWDNNSKLPGGHEINVGAVGPNAAAVAAKLDQRSAYDIAKGEEIPTGGQGLKSDFPNYPIEDRLAELHELPVPANKLPAGKMSYPQLRAHELGHAIVADALGITPVSVLSHLASKGSRSAAEAEVDFTSLGADKDGYFTPEDLRNAIDKLATMFMAGGVAEELYHGVPLHENEAMYGDRRSISTILSKLGFSEPEAIELVNRATSDARDILTKPGLSDIVKSEAKNRQPGLDEKYQIGPERLKEIIQKVKGLNNEGNTKGTSQQDNGVVSKADRGTKGKSTKRSKEESAKIKSGSEVLGG